MPVHDLLDWVPSHVTPESDDTKSVFPCAAAANFVPSADMVIAIQLPASPRALSMSKPAKVIPIVAASQSVKGKPEERELLFRWVDVVDYE